MENKLQLITHQQDGSAFKRATLGTMEQFDLLLNIDFSKSHDVMIEDATHESQSKKILNQNRGFDEDFPEECLHHDVIIDGKISPPQKNNAPINYSDYKFYQDPVIGENCQIENKIKNDKNLKECKNLNKITSKKNEFDHIYMSLVHDRDGNVTFRIRSYKKELRFLAKNLMLTMKKKIIQSGLKIKNIFLNGKLNPLL